MPFIEAPTTFYLGRQYDPTSHRVTDDVVYYDSRDLTTHAVVVGMTGSGKTGLCINLLEEAILDNIPAIVIDPKGDITNLLLTFPELSPRDFEPWVNVDDARRAGMDVPAYSADISHRWKEGLQSWGIVPDRVKWLRAAAKYSIYTPGSDAGLPISILASLRAPREGWAGNEEGIRERISGTVTALLALIGKSATAVEDKEHVLLANIFENSWRQGRDLTLEDIIIQVQRPPFEKLGVFSIDDYMPEKDRFKLAMDLNNIIAAPSFQSWIQGEPLDIQSLLYQPNGRPRVSIFYIAHLSEAERQFIITLLTENMLSWMRTLSGTTSLRALFYIDEMFGYFPPHPRNPPTKEPLLRLLKQARAFGIGMILATQNPGDLDYKGLSNAGTWFIGRLQSANDQRRVMAGLESLVSADNQLDIREVSRLIAEVTPRVFLMHNVHDSGGPILMHTRWAMSYLRGPLTRQQVGILMAQQRREMAQIIAAQAYSQPLVPPTQSQSFGQTGAFPPPPATLPGLPPPPPNLPGFGPPQPPAGVGAGFTAQAAPAQVPPTQPQSSGPSGFTSVQPAVASSIEQYFLNVMQSSEMAIGQWQQRTNFAAQLNRAPMLAYQPMLLAQAAVRYQDKRSGVYFAQHYAYRIHDLDRVGLIHWDEYANQPVDTRSISASPLVEQALYGNLTSGLSDSRRISTLRRELVDMIYNTKRMKVPFNPTLKIYGDISGDPNSFQAQVIQGARERRDAEADKITAQFEKQMDRLTEQLERRQRDLKAEKVELADRKREETFTQGEAFLSLLRGRTTYTLSRTSRAQRFRRQTEKSLEQGEEIIRDLYQSMDDLEAQFQQQLEELNNRWARVASEVEEHVITPYKKDIQVELFGIGWFPQWYLEINGQPIMLAAY
jgi:hypothetical protein